MFTDEMYFLRDVFCFVLFAPLSWPGHSVLCSSSQISVVVAGAEAALRTSQGVWDALPRASAAKGTREPLAWPCRRSLVLPFILSEWRCVPLLAKRRISLTILSQVFTQSGLTHS